MKLHKYIIGLALLVSSSSCNFLDEEAYEFPTISTKRKPMQMLH
jgi:hypothetical protein